METETFAGKTVSRSFNQYEDFDLGAVVKLRSGGPDMTVDGPNGSRVICIWFDLGGEFHRQDFDAGSLEKVATSTGAQSQTIATPAG